MAIVEIPHPCDVIFNPSITDQTILIESRYDEGYSEFLASAINPTKVIWSLEYAPVEEAKALAIRSFFINIKNGIFIYNSNNVTLVNGSFTETLLKSGKFQFSLQVIQSFNPV